MANERSSVINIGGEDYELILTTRATKEIAGRYGGLENLGDKLMKSENFEMAITEVVWLITILANQAILIHNLRHRDEPKPLLSEEEVELLTVPTSPRRRSNCSPCRLTCPDTKPRSPRLCIAAPNGMWKVSLTQKTRKPSKRR